MQKAVMANELLSTGNAGTPSEQSQMQASENPSSCSANELERDNYVVIEGRPGKVIAVSENNDEYMVDKPGEATKTMVTAVDLYTEQKLEGIYDPAEKVDVPGVVSTSESWIDAVIWLIAVRPK